ncbi:hypothetical protein DXG03_005429 [Asterophora parasitica]|uniref:Uncharacterized protein n=1 Tax=Asterophora parasitica TaxID=117018 RepID=A0A9P7KCM8_9AGAR|nr:hypothetical protein DXG03_005429 [Asterophora parasitica]
MDTNWCLACDCHFEGAGPYCSPVCKGIPDDDDDDVLFHQITDVRDVPAYAGILAWASSIPPSSPPDHAPTPSTSRSSSKSRRSRLPKLMRPHQRAATPAMSMTVPRTVLPSSPTRPILTPQQHHFFSEASPGPSTATASLVSAPTESSLATPASTLALGRIGTLVRDWVSPPAKSKFCILAHPSPIHFAYSHYHDLPTKSSSLANPRRGRTLSRS